MLGCHSGNSLLTLLRYVTPQNFPAQQRLCSYTASQCHHATATWTSPKHSSSRRSIASFQRKFSAKDLTRQSEARKSKALSRLAEEEDKKRRLGNTYKPLSHDSVKKLLQTAEDGKWRGRLAEDMRLKAQQEEAASKERLPWQVQKEALRRKFGDAGWNPIKKLSPDAIDGIRALNQQQPEVFTTEVLSNEFEVSPEAIRRILKSKWKPDDKTAVERRERWERRGNKIWATKAEQGVKPPVKWRQALGIKLGPRDGTGRRPGLGPGSVATLSQDQSKSTLAEADDPQVWTTER